MSKITGMGSKLFLDGINITGQVGAIDTLAAPLSVGVCTDISQLGFARQGLLRDGLLEFSSTWLNADGAHTKLDDLPTVDVSAVVAMPAGVGNIMARLGAKQVNYDMDRPEDGSLNTKVQCVGSDGLGLEYGIQLSAGDEDFTGTAQTASTDNAVATTGGALFVVCTEFTGTTLDVDLQQSTDDGAGDAFANIDASASLTVTVEGSQRSTIGAAVGVERYVRANISGTFTTATLLIGYTRGPVV